MSKNSVDSEAALKKLQEKLSSLEKHLRELVTTTEEDLHLAAELQKILHPNRLKTIIGAKCLARFISAAQISSESFDIFPTAKGREAWFISAWTETFGLSSVLLQAMMHIQSEALLSARPNVSPEEVFNDLSISLSKAKRGGQYRLMVAKFDTFSHRFAGVSIGNLPWLIRSKSGSTYSNLNFQQPEALRANKELLESAHSDAPTTSERAYVFSFPLSPGDRIFHVSRGYASRYGLEEALKFLEPANLGQGSELTADLNHILMKAEDHLKFKGEEADISAVALEFDPSKMHLA